MEYFERITEQQYKILENRLYHINNLIWKLRTKLIEMGIYKPKYVDVWDTRVTIYTINQSLSTLDVTVDFLIDVNKYQELKNTLSKPYTKISVKEANRALQISDELIRHLEFLNGFIVTIRD